MDTIAADLRRHRSRRAVLTFGVLVTLVVFTFLLRLLHGSTNVPLTTLFDLIVGKPIPVMDQLIMTQLRLPNTVTGLLAGAALGVSGLQMQTLFANPLADPYVLGVSSGASCGVALLILAPATWVGVLGAQGRFAGSLGTTLAASLGAAVVMGVVLVVGTRIRSAIVLLLLGVMFGAMISALVTVLLSGARPELVSEYVAWSFGSYRGTTLDSLKVLVPVLLVTLLISVAMGPWLNVLQLGDRYAQTVGVRIGVLRGLLIALTAVLAGTTTAFCGPIQFLGIALPHIARQILKTADQRLLLPATALLGGALALLIDAATILPGGTVLPLNAANAAVGAPVVIWVLLRNARKAAA